MSAWSVSIYHCRTETPTVWLLTTWNDTVNWVATLPCQMGAPCSTRPNCRPSWASLMRWRGRSRRGQARWLPDPTERSAAECLRHEGIKKQCLNERLSIVSCQAVLSEEELLGAEPTALVAPPVATLAPAPAPPAPAPAPGPTSNPFPVELNYSKMRNKLELEEKMRAINMLQAALVRSVMCLRVVLDPGSGLWPSAGSQAQQTELTVKLDKELKLQKDQYETTIFGHLSFIDQVGEWTKLEAFSLFPLII